MSNPTITSDSSNITVSNANLICDNDILANAFFDVNGIVLSGGGGGPSSDTLTDVVNRGNVTSNTVQFTNTGMSLVTSGSISVGNQIQTPAGAIVITNSNNSITTSNVNATYLGAVRNITSPYSSNILLHTLENEVISADLSLNTLTAAGFSTTGVVTAGTFSGDGGTLSNLATVATSGAYSDLSGTPTLATVATSGSYSDLTGTPTLATVATSGAYSDLTGTPTIPTNTSDLTNDSNFVASTSLATVATSGAYSDLSGTPTIPTNTSDLTNDSNFATTVYVTSEISNVVGSAPSALDTLNELASALDNDANFAGTVTTSISTKLSIADAANTYATTASLSTVATSGAYSDLAGTPTIPSNTSDLTNDSNFVASTSLATVATSGAYSDLTGTPTIPTSITNLDVTDGTNGQFLTTDGAGTFTFATVSASGSSNLQQVTDTGNVTSNTIILNGSFVTGNNATSVTATSNTLTLDMEGKSYKTFTCSTSNSIETITISNDILGSQGMVFLTATGDINIFGTTSNLGGTNVNVSYDDISVSSGEKALIGFMSDGTQRFINASKYPSAGGGGGLSNLETITTNGNVATTTVQLTNSNVGLVATGNVQANYFIGDGSQLTGISGGGGGGGTQAYIDVYDSTGGQTAPTGGVVLNLDTTRISSGDFTLSNDTVIFNKAGTYKVDFRVTTTVTSSTRSDSFAQLYKNNSLVAGSRIYMYNRLSTQGENTGAAAAIVSMSSSDYISIKVFEDSGASIQTIVNGSGVVITELLT